MKRLVAAVVLNGLLLVPAAASAADRSSLGREIAEAVTEASVRSGLPPDWISAVLSAESGGDPSAVSPAGALGLMQLMPGTWADLRARLGLGSDPFDVRDNVTAGAVYLRQMWDAYGPRGFLEAYNAGPARYEVSRAGGRPLPRGARLYAAHIQARLGLRRDLPAAGGPHVERRSRSPWSSGLIAVAGAADAQSLR